MTTVEISFRLFAGWSYKDERVVALAKQHGGKPGDCGAGLGFRDREFKFRTQTAADAFALEVGKLDVEVFQQK